ncbi:MAG TPA: PKD domain-containing protein, partial [Bacteroidales bacterium]
MRRFYNFIFIFLLTPLVLHSQGEWNNWYFGWMAAATFNSGTPVGVSGSAMKVSGCATSNSISDSLGNLLFYTNGFIVYNNNNLMMPNSIGLSGGNICSQPIFSVQMFGNPKQYYLFTVGESDPTSPPIIGLHYSILDMTLQGGLGDIVVGQKNIPIPIGDSAVNQLTGIRHANNKDVWIVVLRHGAAICQYLAYKVTPAGISSPVISTSGLKTRFFQQFGQTRIRQGGDLKISQDGSKLVCSDSLTEICDFNSETGIVTPKFKINLSALGAEFSIDSKYLYLCMEYGSGFEGIGWQFDLAYDDSLSFIQHQVVIGNNLGCKLQMGPDWKIYGPGNPLQDSLNCINYPSLPGLTCGYQKNAVALTAWANCCVVQFLQKYKAYIHNSGFCQNNQIKFTGDVWPPPDSLHWDFGDPASGINNYSNLTAPSHIYQNTGTYTVELFVRHIDNRTDTSWQTITVTDSPIPELGSNKSICSGDSVLLDAGYWANVTYSWDNITTGQLNIENNQFYKAKAAGNYRVTVTNTNGCIGKDSVLVSYTSPPILTTTPLYDTICSGQSTSIALTSNPSGAIFHWTATLSSGNITGFSADSGTVINQTLTNTLSTPGIVTYHITPKIGSCTGTTVNFPVTVVPGDSVKVTITTLKDSVCAGTSITFTAHPTNPGANPHYQWQVNGVNKGTDSTLFTFVPTNGDLVKCILTSSIAVCVSNNPASSIHHQVTVSPVQ